jgi:fibronectin type 3 domain-containing protein
MKKLILSILLIYLVIINSGCSNQFSSSFYNNPNLQAKVDYNLPSIDSSQIRYISDLSSIAFEWNMIKNPRVIGYVIYRSSVNDKKPKRISVIKDKHSTHFVDKNLKPNSIYLYQFGTIGYRNIESQKSEIKAINTLSSLEPISYIHAISNLPKKIKIIWRPHASKTINKYFIYKNINNSWKKIKTISNRLSVEYIDTHLQDNSTHSYKIYAVSFNNIMSKGSNIIEAKTKPLPTRITNISITKDLPKKIVVNWSTNYNDISHFNIYRSKDVLKGFKKIGQTKGTQYSNTINKDGAIYFYKISITDTDNLEGITSDITGIMGKTLNRPPTPIISYIQLENNNQINIKWETQDDRSKTFTIIKEYINNDLSFLGVSKREKFDSIKNKEFIDTNIKDNCKYKYYIYGIDEFGISSIKSPPSIIIIQKNNK